MPTMIDRLHRLTSGVAPVPPAALPQPTLQPATGTDVLVGYTADGPVVLDVASHALIIGRDDQCRTRMALRLVAQWAAAGNRTCVLGGGHAYGSLQADVVGTDGVAASLSERRAVLSGMFDVLRRESVDHWSHLPEGLQPRPLLLVVNGFETLSAFHIEHSTALADLQALARLGRVVGIHVLVLADDHNNLPEALTTNLSARVAVDLDATCASRRLLGIPQRRHEQGDAIHALVADYQFGEVVSLEVLSPSLYEMREFVLANL